MNRLFLLLSFSPLTLASPYLPFVCHPSEGKTYANQEKFIEGSFVKQCDSNAAGFEIKIVACLSPSKTEIPLGKTREEKEGSFVKECRSTASKWEITIVACLTPSGKEIAVGTEAEEKNIIYSCVKTENGASIQTRVVEKPAENRKCQGKYEGGEKFIEGNFVKKCFSSPNYEFIAIVNCLTPEKKEIALGAEFEENSVIFSCIKHGNGGAKIESRVATPQSNMKCNGIHENGEKYTEGNFVKLCTSSPNHAAVTIVACLTPEKKEIPVGSKLEEKSVRYSCIKTEKGAKIETEFVEGGNNGKELLCKDKYKNGDKFTEGNFVNLCTSNQYYASSTVVGCLTLEKKEIAVGRELVEARLLSDNKKFEFKCLDDFGNADIIGCVHINGQKFAVGEEKVIDYIKHKCYRDPDSGSVKYEREVARVIRN